MSPDAGAEFWTRTPYGYEWTVVDGGRRYRPLRPFCIRCGEHANSPAMLCDWHWGVLSEATQAQVAANIAERHPRGGQVRRVTEAILVTARSNARREWAAQQAIEDAEAAEDISSGRDPLT